MAQASSDRLSSDLLPAVPYLVASGEGAPYLVGSRCGACGAVLLGERRVCAACGERNRMARQRLSDRGELYTYTIVYRSFPGVAVPYVSAVVDLEGGGTVKGTLIGIEPDPEKIKAGMPVEVVYDRAPLQDREGNSYLAYFFRPRAG
jgi:uncharacterized OB-fold protein